jgi:hypothetical protein
MSLVAQPPVNRSSEMLPDLFELELLGDNKQATRLDTQAS